MRGMAAGQPTMRWLAVKNGIVSQLPRHINTRTPGGD